MKKMNHKKEYTIDIFIEDLDQEDISTPKYWEKYIPKGYEITEAKVFADKFEMSPTAKIIITYKEK